MKVGEREARKIIDSLDFKGGLVTAIARDSEDGEILMTAFMNEEAVLKSLTTGLMHYWSRSRRKLWRKGEESGHVQRIREVRVDCDGDSLLFDVEQEGGACHKGYRSCFYRRVEDGELIKILEKEFEPGDVYG